MAIYISGAEYEHREILLREKPLEMLASSPKGTVPVLVLPDGRVLEESLDIMHWALTQNDPENWLNSVNQNLIDANDGPFKSALDRYKYPTRYDQSNPDEERDKACPHLERLNQILSHQAFLAGSRRGFTDVALFPFIRQFANTDRAWFDSLPLQPLQHWLEQLLTSRLFDAIMTKYPRWTSLKL